MTRRLYCFTIFIFFALSTVAAGQVQLGMAKYASIGGGPADKINLGSLNVHYQIPVRHKAGRGLAFNFDLSFDSSVWVPVTSGSSKTWGLLTSLGWSASSIDIGFLQDNYTSDSQYDYDCVVYYEAVGSGHSFPQCAAYDYVHGIDYPIANSITTDGSGYTLNYDPFGTGIGNLHSVEGNAIIPRNVVPLGQGVKAGSDIDRNGNEISADSSGNFTDTLGTTALTQSGGCTSQSSCTPYVMSYTAPSGATAPVTVTFAPYTVRTNFGCSGISEFPATTIDLVDKITLPDSTYYQFTYESTPGFSGDVTARVKSVRIPTGATMTYTYSGGNNGIECSDGSTAGFTRGTPDGSWTYARALGTGNASTTTITDPQGNQTVITFQKDSAATNNTYTFYETQRNIYQGSSSTGTLVMGAQGCYNNNANGCPNPTSVSSPITQTDYYTEPPGLSGSISETKYNNYGLPTDHKDFDWGNVLKREIIYSYPNNLGSVKAFWQSITVTDGTGAIFGQTTNRFDETAVITTSGTPQHVSVGSNPRGNLTSVVQRTTGFQGSDLTKTYTYFDTGNIDVATDVNGAQTTYTYGACGNSFLTNTSEPLSLSTSAAWNCNGGVQISSTDENGNINYTNYTSDPYFWRPESTKDALGNVTGYTYTGQTKTESVLSFNGGASAVDTLTTSDSLGRQFLTQTRQAPGSSNFDSVETFYDSLGRQTGTSIPYTGTAGQATSAGASPKATYDPAGRISKITDNGGANTTYSYTGNLVLVTVGPAPSGENTKRRQLAYDGLGRLTQVCEITSASGSGTCAMGVTQTGYWTEYNYDALNNLTGMLQNAQGTSQGRSYIYDGLNRLIRENNPESGEIDYVYDSYSGSCSSTSKGDLVQKHDANGNFACFGYDALHRLQTIGQANGGQNSSVTPDRCFGYDWSAVGTVTISNPKGHLVEAYTTPHGTGCGGSNKPTDEVFSYSKRGETTDIWEGTPDSGGWIHTSVAYWANGSPQSLIVPGLPTISYGADGEGRTSTVSASSGQNPVTSTSYNSASLIKNVTFGSADSDAFTYDTNTFRMTQYKFSVNGSSETGTLTWNANATLKTLAIADPFNSSDAQTCNYTHDDMGRIASASCGSVWSQTFTYDPFGNITKSGSSSWQPGYNEATNRYTLGGTSYDANGDLLNDSSHTYTWDAYGRPLTIDGITLVYDAFEREVEQTNSGTHTEIVYSPTGQKLALFNGQSLKFGFVPLPGGATAYYQSWGLNFYRHPDWLGSERLDSSTSHVIAQNTAYAPFGEPYATMSGGNGDYNFTGQNKDTLWLQFDFMFRQYSPTQSRWVSPDPAGRSAVDTTDPQSWNRYTYLANRPTNQTDFLGLDDCGDWGLCGGDWGEWDGNFGESLGIPTGIVYGRQPETGYSPCDFLACGSATAGVNSFHQATDANGVTWDVGDYDGEITCQAGGLFCAVWNALTQTWEQAPPDNASKLADALNKTGVQNLANPCTIGAWYLTSAAVGAGGVAAPAAGRLAAQAAADNAPTLVHWGLSKLMGPMMPPGEGVLAGARFYGSLALAGGKWLGNKIGSSVQSGCNALAQ